MTARNSPLLLVIGATGTVGRQVVRQLTAKGVRVRAMTRSPETARLPAEVEIVRGDLTSPETLDQCLEGVDTVFLVWTAPRTDVDAALARITRRARHVVFLSAPLKTPHPFFQQPNPARALALHLEHVIEQSGVKWTFLRPGMFAANSLDFWGPQIRAGSVVRWPYLSAPTAPIDERDIAAVGVRAMTEAGHDEMEYVLTGPQSLTQYEQIMTIGGVLGRTVTIEELTRQEARQAWAATMPGAVADMLMDAWAAAMGQPAFVTDTVEQITGTPARAFAEWTRDNASAFAASPA